MVIVSFGSKLRELRNSAGLTQSELAQRINRSKANISKYEKDDLEPNLDTLVAISEIFDVSIDYLLGKKPGEAPAGSSHSAPQISKDVASIIEFYDELSHNGREKALEYMEMLRDKEKKENGND